MDSSVSPTHGEQEIRVWNGHYACTCYHPLFVFNQFGDLERCALRPGNVHSAEGWGDVLKPVGRRVLQQARHVRTMDQGRQDCDQLDAAVVQDVRGQCSAAPTSCTYVAFQMAEVAIPRQMFQEILRLIAELRPQPPPAPSVRRSIVMRSRATDGRSASKCHAKWPDQTLDHRSSCSRSR